MKKIFHFSGYATKAGLECADGRVIHKSAFKHNDGQTVPLVWQHMHNDPSNILGHALLEHRDDGVYAYCTFNGTDSGEQAKALVEHGDIKALSIHANQLKEKGKNVLHGMIREVSLVLAGANPGAFIENVSIQHSDGSSETMDNEAIIYHDGDIDLEEIEIDLGDLVHDDDDGETIGDIFSTLNAKQRDVVYALISQALEGDDDDDDVEHSDDDEENLTHNEGGKDDMKKNIFDNSENTEVGTLTHAQFKTILNTAEKVGSLKEAILSHAQEYGIEDIDVLFPDAKMLSKDPEWLKREDDWVSGVLKAAGKTPFSRVKSVFADMDIDTARAKGYITGDEKKEVYFKAAKRVTTPQTVYVKQKLDRDDILDVTDFDVVAMVRFQLRTLLDEELAQAIIIGDGREADDQHKINEDNIRPVWKEDDLYCVKETLTTDEDFAKMVEEIAFTHHNYKGSGSPVLYTTPAIHTRMLWIKDLNQRRIYENDASLAAALRVSRIEEIPQMDEKFRVVGEGEEEETRKLMAIKVNLRDYNIGADKGGQVASFDDFDIDFNQYKYLMETRVSGALTKAKCAQVFEFVVAEEEEAEG